MIRPIRGIRSFVALAVWLQMLSYLRGFRSTGPYVRTLLEMVVDLRAFLALYLLITCGFAHAIYLQSGTKPFPEAAEEMLQAFRATYRMGTLGDFDANEFEGRLEMYVLFFACTAIIAVVLLNVLIAVVSDTYARIQQSRESAFVKGQAQLIADIETIFGRWDPPEFIVFSEINGPNTNHQKRFRGCADGLV